MTRGKYIFRTNALTRGISERVVLVGGQLERGMAGHFAAGSGTNVFIYRSLSLSSLQNRNTSITKNIVFRSSL